MEKQIICMGNSYKNGGRCLAGIEIQSTTSGVSIVRNHYGLPNWIRPVMSNGDNGLPEYLVGSFAMLDILSVDVTDAVPIGAHCENVSICKRIDPLLKHCNKSFNGREYRLNTTSHDFDFVVSHNGKSLFIEVKTTVGNIKCSKDFPLIFETKEWEWIDIL